jgi:CRISPR-associated endoribonuclease Cas6
MLTAIVLHLKPAEEGCIPISHGDLAHAAAFDLFSRLDPSLSKSLHDNATRKPFTISPLGGTLRRKEIDFVVTPNVIYPWRISGLTSEMAGLLAKISPELGNVLFKKTTFKIEAIARIPEDHPEAGTDLFSSLFSRWSKRSSFKAVTLRFLTPTTFRIGRVEQPIPLPGLVFGSLLAAWHCFAQERLEISKEVIEAKVVVSHWEGETQRVEMGDCRTVGCIGKFTYRLLDPGPEFCRMIGLLSEFAFYAGVGWQTARGLGQVRPELHFLK